LPFVTESAAIAAEPSLESGDVHLLTTGATGLPATTGVDTRVADAFYLRNGPYQLTGPFLPYNSLTGDMIHSFHQMWQQSDCSVSHATRANPSGCLNDLYPFVAATSAATSQGGGTAMAFYNVNQGDAPYLKQLADEYTMSDNYHQAQMGGSTVEHLYLAMADTIYYSDGRGNPAQPPAARIANPDPLPGTVNQYTGGGAQYVACADPSQPGVAPIVNYLQSLPRPLNPNCAPGHYYLINNLLPGYNIDGTINVNPKAVPPSNVRTIGDALGENNLSFRYYAGGYNDLVAGKPNRYCGVCNPFQFMSSVMSDGTARAEHLKDTTDFFSDLSKGTLPTVAFVKPSGYLDGHPGGSTLGLFEAFVKHVVDDVKADPKLFAETAIFITFDEAGGYYDSGYIQPLDFQGDGPRIPLIVVSPFARGGRIVHSYSDHASIVKFIERNWRLAPLSNRSRDNLPNPIADDDNPYVPVNSPAIGDLFDLFDIDHAHDHDNRGGHDHGGGESGDGESSR
jgi:phospholipase C